MLVKLLLGRTHRFHSVPFHSDARNIVARHLSQFDRHDRTTREHRAYKSCLCNVLEFVSRYSYTHNNYTIHRLQYHVISNSPASLAVISRPPVHNSLLPR